MEEILDFSVTISVGRVRAGVLILLTGLKSIFPTFVPKASGGVDLEQFKIRSNNKESENRKFLLSLKKKDSRKVDEVFHAAHDEVFEEFDCLACANCCKTTSPIFYETDIERVSKALRMKPGDFVEKYLRIDEDKDYVLKSSPCPFLDSENYCMVYEDRPKACREYPHTDRKKMVQITELTFRNTKVCPAVFEMVERIKRIKIQDL